MHLHLFVTIRAIHVLAASLWVGAAVLNAAYLIPAVMASGPAGGQVMRAMAHVRRLPVFMNTVMATTIVTGGWLYWADSDGMKWSWTSSGTGIAFTLGALLAFVTAGLGVWITVPTVKRLGQLGAAAMTSGGAPGPEMLAQMGALQRRLLGVSRVGATLVALSALLMSVARFQ
jgi:uncharacterized membrane protein